MTVTSVELLRFSPFLLAESPLISLQHAKRMLLQLIILLKIMFSFRRIRESLL